MVSSAKENIELKPRMMMFQVRHSAQSNYTQRGRVKETDKVYMDTRRVEDIKISLPSTCLDNQCPPPT